MSRHPRFEENRYLGDKRSLLLYDSEDAGQLEILEALPIEQIASFAPDTPVEAFNRCYRPSSELAASESS